MKFSLFSRVAMGFSIASALALGGCGSSSAPNPPVSEAQSVETMRKDTSIPAPAQSRMDEQIANKQKLDQMRAADAAKAKGAP